MKLAKELLMRACFRKGGMPFMNHPIKLKRRQMLGGLTAGTALLASGISRGALSTMPALIPPGSMTPAELARNEVFWRAIAGYYDRTEGVVNLEHGYWGKMASPVKAAYVEATDMVNAQNSFYARKGYADDEKAATARIAAALGAHEDEIVITRNATEAIDNLIRQYQGLEPRA
jgi:hypothetical protein